MAAPIERKVAAATGGSAVGTVLVAFILWLLDTYVWGETPIPEPVVAMVALLPALLTAAAGYWAKHTPRPDVVDPVLTMAPKTRNRATGHVRVSPKAGGYPGGDLPREEKPPPTTPTT